jgi:hypothetical protein
MVVIELAYRPRFPRIAILDTVTLLRYLPRILQNSLLPIAGFRVRPPAR